MERKLTFPEKIIRKDIKYRGVLSYRGLRILGWIAMCFGVIATTLGFGIRIVEIFGNNNAAKVFGNVSNVFSFIAILPIPLFLFANFGIIINGRDNYKRLLIKFGALAAAIYVIFLFAYLRYGLLIANKLLGDSQTLNPFEFFDILTRNSLAEKLYFNVFIDMVLCTLVSYFLNYTPKKYFVGKKLIIFRLMVFIPLLYELLAVLLKAYDGVYYYMPTFFAPILPSKPPLLILVFVGITLFMKLRENHILKKTGMSKEEYHAFLKDTNGASLMYDIICSIALLAASLIDLTVYLVYAYNDITPAMDALFTRIGVGNSMGLVLAIPIIMLYSFNKKVKKNSTIELLIPIGGIALMVISFLESAFYIFMAI